MKTKFYQILSQARMFYELLSRDHGDGCATEQPQGIGSETYLNSTSQGPIPEDARKDSHIRGRSRQLLSRFIHISIRRQELGDSGHRAESIEHGVRGQTTEDRRQRVADFPIRNSQFAISNWTLCPMPICCTAEGFMLLCPCFQKLNWHNRLNWPKQR